MKKTILAALLVSASIGSQVFNAGATVATVKVGVLSFALSDSQQVNILTNNPVAAPNTYTSIPFDFSTTALENCVAVQYKSQTVQVNNKSILQAISVASGNIFTANAKLVIIDYDNRLDAPPYPPYLLEDGQVFNGPRDPATGELLIAAESVGDFGNWPNNVTIDWVEYDDVHAPDGPAPSDVSPWPKARVIIADPSNANFPCYDVSHFFSFEEAYCHFCWDTMGRVTQGTIKNNSKVSPGTPCILPTASGCAVGGNATTKYYLTVKFNNSPADNIFLVDAEGNPLPPLGSEGDRLIFQVGGVVNYVWSYKTLNGLAGPFGTHTMSQANGNGIFPYCGVFTGNIKISETTNIQVPLCTD